MNPSFIADLSKKVLIQSLLTAMGAILIYMIVKFFFLKGETKI